MGLAHLEWVGHGAQGHEFEIDLGTNRYYRYAVGSDETIRRHGMELLSEPRNVSPVRGPLPERSLGRTVLTIPDDAFDRENRHVQLMSYRTEQMASPSVSDIVPVMGAGRSSRGGGLDDLPPISFAASHAPRRTRYRTSQQMSEAMFLGALVSALPNILPAVAPLIQQAVPAIGRIATGLLGGLRGQQGATTGNQTADQITQILNQVLQALGQRTQQQAPAAQPAQAAALTYSEAQIAPAAIAALAPLLGQVLTPQTIQSLLQTVDPNRLLGTTIEGLKAAGRLAIESAEQDNRHIRELHPGNDDPLLTQLLNSMSVSLAQEPAMRGSHRVKLHIDDGPSHTVGGRTRVLFSRDVDLVPQISVETPKTIGRAKLDIRLKDRDSLEVLHHERSRLSNVTSGVLAHDARIPAQVLGGLAPGEYLLCATLRWKTTSGDIVGADRRQLVTLMGGVIFDRMEPGGELVPLNDVQRHREFWHEVWRTELTRSRNRLRVSAQYLLSVEPDAADSGRMSTDAAERPEDGKTRVRLRSGSGLSVEQLNALLPERGQLSLDGDQLAALGERDVVAQMTGEARGSGRINGRPGQSASVWVYPEVRMQPIVLQRAAELAPSGQVLALNPETVVFPIPALIHLIGTRST